MTKRILITKEKGGGGATTTATNLAYELADRGYGVLLIDMDTRGDCAPCFGLDPSPWLTAALEALPSSGSFATAAADGLDIITTNTSSTSAAIRRMEALPLDAAAIDVAALDGNNYDFVIYDTSAASGALRRAAMQVADLMIVPTRVEALGMPDIATLVEAYGKPAKVIVLPIAYRKQLGVHQYNLGLLQEAYGDGMAAPIPDRVAVIESHSAMQPVIAYDPTNDASLAYQALTDRTLAMLEIEDPGTVEGVCYVV